MSITQTHFRKRRAVIGALLFVLGAVVYLTVSGAPPRVHLVTVPAELALAAVATYFVSVVSLAAWQRLVGLIIGLTCVSLVTTWLSSKVVAALTPLDAWYFVVGVGAAFIKATLLIGAVWLIDFTIELVLSKRHNRRRSVRVLIIAPLLLLLVSRCVTVAAVIEEPEVISRGELVYPPELRARGVEGLVKLEMIVGTDGVPRDVRVIRDDPSAPPIDEALEQFALETVKAWRFKPATANGKTIERRYVTAIHWRAQNES